MRGCVWCVVVVEEAGYFSGTRLRTWTGSEDRGFWRLVGSLRKYFRGFQAAVVCRSITTLGVCCNGTYRMPFTVRRPIQYLNLVSS
jgi:hypothetical protein